MVGFADKIRQEDHSLSAYVLEVLSSIENSLPFVQQTPIRQPLLPYFFLYCRMLNEVDEDLFEDDEFKIIAKFNGHGENNWFDLFTYTKKQYSIFSNHTHNTLIRDAKQKPCQTVNQKYTRFMD